MGEAWKIKNMDIVLIIICVVCGIIGSTLMVEHMSHFKWYADCNITVTEYIPYGPSTFRPIILMSAPDSLERVYTPAKEYEEWELTYTWRDGDGCYIWDCTGVNCPLLTLDRSVSVMFSFAMLFIIFSGSIIIARMIVAVIFCAADAGSAPRDHTRESIKN